MEIVMVIFNRLFLRFSVCQKVVELFNRLTDTLFNGTLANMNRKRVPYER